jgi:hypothetical protein
MKPSRIAVALFATLACAVLHAQTTDLRANVPFDFRLGQKVMPAGAYRIIERSPGLLVVQEQGGHHMTQAFLTLPVSRRDAPAKGQLQFTRYGDTYFLSKVWSENSRDGRAFPKSTEEKEFASRAGPIHAADVSLARK